MESLSAYHYLAFFGASLGLSLILTPLVRSLARATGQVAVPRDTRWHKKETALLGGVAIFIATVGVWTGGVLILDWESAGKPFLPVILCASGVFLLGLVDDIVSLVPQHKLAAQIIIVSVFMTFGFRLDWTISRTADLFLSILWIVGITNAFNLLDNMDGLAAGVALIAGIFLFLTHYMNPVVAPLTVPFLVLCSVYLGALLGFLAYNFNPASIFMGDAGSLFLGFIMASMTMVGGGGESVGYSAGKLLSVIAIPILILFIPILDTGFVSFMRKLFRRPISQGGRDHSSHRLVAIGFSERMAVMVLYGFAAASGLIALAVNSLSIGITLVLILFYLLFVGFFWIYLARVKVYEERSILSGEGTGTITPILIQFTYRRRLFEVILDLILITAAYYTAYLLRFEGPVYYLIGENFRFFLNSLPIVVACQIFCFFVLGIYRGIWEATGLSDLIDYIKAITLGTVMAMLILLFVYRFESFSRAVFIIHWVLLLLLISLSRLSFRLVDEGVKKGKQKGKSVLIYGAGTGGRMAAKEIENNPSLGLVIVGFLDDNPRKFKKKIMGYPVLGGREELEKIVRKRGVQGILVAFKARGEEVRRELQVLFQKLDMEVEVRQMKMILE
ncbi:MAG: glycosyl transferase [Deltaproteobacteria bacterium]|nr:glycosyl transferase [Deltaproteobacteria bacterium]